MSEKQCSKRRSNNIQKAYPKRIAPPSYNLTSEEHVSFITSRPTKKVGKNSKKKQMKTKTKKPQTSKAKSVKSRNNFVMSNATCPVCHIVENTKEDVHPWIACHRCMTWFHEPCGEQYGILDDDNFTCQQCFDSQN